jgi:hypothetical protein
MPAGLHLTMLRLDQQSCRPFFTRGRILMGGGLLSGFGWRMPAGVHGMRYKR